MSSVSLTRTRRLATTLLVVMVLVFALTFAVDAPWVEFVRAFSEAAMVGALADWFAVTALFRRPLGLPIPHTAIIPNNQERIGRSLGQFIEKNFLSDEVITQGQLDLIGTSARWLAKEDGRQFVLSRIRTLVPRLGAALQDKDVSSLIRDSLVSEIRRIDVAPAMGELLGILTAGDAHEVILDEVVKLSRGFFRKQQPWIREKLQEASPWFLPDFVEDKIFHAIVRRTEETLAAALTDRNHELRRKLHEAMSDFVEQLKTSPEYRERGNEIKAILLENEVFLNYVASVREGLISVVTRDLESKESRIIKVVDNAIKNFAELALSDREFHHRANQAVKRVVGLIIGAHREDIADVIAHTVKSWKSELLVSRLEEQVGKDLQYIRINGTIVGGLCGVLIYVVTKLLAPV